MVLKRMLLAVAVCLIPLCLAEPPVPSYLPPYELSAPAESSFSSYASPRPVYNAPAPTPVYHAPPPAPVYRAPTPRPSYGAPKRAYSAPKPVRYNPPTPVYSAPSPPPATYLPVSAPSSNYGAPRRGSSNHGHEEYYSEPAKYMYQYGVHDDHYGTDFGHKESRDGDATHGQYMVLLPDGRRQIVDYVADKHGYRPTIRYEGEPMRHGY